MDNIVVNYSVDILGFTALTKGQIVDITKKDYEAGGVNSEEEHSYSDLVPPFNRYIPFLLFKFTSR